MSVNKYQDHVLVIPEDDAIRQMANGFLLDPFVRTDKVQILPPARGWQRVLENFETEYIGTMTIYPMRHLVLLIDCDDDADRLHSIRDRIPKDCADRVFILGIASEAEVIKRELGSSSFENIGKDLAADCRNNTNKFWGHAQLQDNAHEISRLREFIYPIMFGRDCGE